MNQNCLELTRSWKHEGCVIKARLMKTCNNIIATSARNTKIYLYDLDNNSNESQMILNGHDSKSFAMDWKRHGNDLLTGSEHGIISLYQLD